MLDVDAARRICDAALAASRADGCEVALGGGMDALTRFAGNAIHQNMASEGYELVVRSILGRRTGRASTTRLDAAGIAAVVAESERVTRHMPERDDLLPLLGPQTYREVSGAFDAATAQLEPEARAAAVRALVDAAATHGFECAGIVRNVAGRVGEYGEKGTLALANSAGLFAWHRETRLHVSVTVQGPDSSGWADATVHAARDLDAAALGRVAVEKAHAASRPRPLEPGAYTVVLEPAAVAELLAFLAPEFSATVVHEGRSFLSGREARGLFGPGITLRDDPYHALHRGVPFDEEGVPVQPVTLVERGDLTSLVYDRLAAGRHGVVPTGHGLRVPSSDGAAASHLVLEGGDQTTAQLVAGVERGILVTRFWYTRPVDPTSLLITGMTRDGTFWIEDGRIRHGIRNMRFNQSLVDLLRSVRVLGRPEYAVPAVVPPVVADGFHFTSVTSF